MKHPNNRRPIVAALVLVLILSVLPVAALADTLVFQDIFSSREGYIGDTTNILDSKVIQVLPNSTESQTISIRDYDRRIQINGQWYEFMGMGSWNTTKKIPIDNKLESIVIPPFPKDGTDQEKDAWFKNYGEIALLYGPAEKKAEPGAHVHAPLNDQWFTSDTNHWRICKDCGQYYDMDWHHDWNEDGKCDYCGMTILRYPIKVLECEGGKITVSQEDGVYNDVVDVTVETNPGYTFKQIHFFKMDEKRHEIIRWVDEFGSKYHFDMPYYDVEVEAEFIKN